MNVRNLILLVIAAGITLPAQAGVAISGAWIRATAPGETTAAVYLQIKSDAPATLVSVSSPVAKAAEIHEVKMQGDVMQMRPLNSLDLPAGKTVEFKRGSYHIMLIDIAQPLKAGDVVPLILTVEGVDQPRRSIKVKAQVRGAMSTEKPGDMGGMKGM